MQNLGNRKMQYPVGKSIELTGWVGALRQHKKIVFVDLRRRDDLVQLVIEGGSALKTAERLSVEDVIKIQGKVRKRPQGLDNPKIPSGKIEVTVDSLKILSKSAGLPFELRDTKKVNEETRLKYRYLDLRSQRMKQNLKARHQVSQFIRDFLTKRGFWEIETPFLTKSTPEGARDYVVPSRLHPGKFYALPQSPQQYKQLLMVAGVEKYFQLVRCMRDEDQRGDRQPEFTQLDMEMSFVKQEDIMKLNEELLIAIVKKLYPKKRIQTVPFPRLTYRGAMKKYQTDRPDLRKDKKDTDLLAFCWIIDYPFFKKTREGQWTFTHNPFSAPKPEHMEDLRAKKNISSILTTQYDVVLNGLEIAGGSIRNHRSENLKAVFEIIGLSEKKINRDFGHIIESFDYGVPPHGGIAWGYDRFMMLMQEEKNIREVIAFPKTGDGRDPMMESPSELDSEQLKELSLRIIK
jgi:aspartyl-tRNA synthetase